MHLKVLLLFCYDGRLYTQKIINPGYALRKVLGDSNPFLRKNTQCTEKTIENFERLYRQARLFSKPALFLTALRTELPDH